MKTTAFGVSITILFGLALFGCASEEAGTEVEEGNVTGATTRTAKLTKAQLEGVRDCVTSVEEEMTISLGGPSTPSGNWVVNTGGEYSANACFAIIRRKFPGAQLLAAIDDNQTLRILTISGALTTRETGPITKAQLESVDACVDSVMAEMSTSLEGASGPSGDWLVTTKGEHSTRSCFLLLRQKFPGAQLLGTIEDLKLLIVSGKKRQ